MVDEYWIITSPTSPLFLGYETCDQLQGGEQIQIEAATTFLIIFGALMNILFCIKVKVSCAHETVV